MVIGKMSGRGHGTQVIVLKDHSYQLDEKLLEQVLLKEEIKNLPVVVLSVAGRNRGGKSFLLNIIVRYLSSPESAQQDGSWLAEDSEPLAGFNWRAGAERHTTGILLWSEPYITTLSSGEKVAIILMDTEGTFDSKSTSRDNSTIFALSTLISSVQIYNLSKNIQEDDLQNLRFYSMYGNMVRERNDGGKAFQTLCFLVRDWPYDDHAFGAEGGYELLQKRLKVTPDQPNELRDVRNHLRSSFEEVFCFLMPHPGSKVERPEFKGHIKDIKLQFRKHMADLVSSLLSPKKICLKTINGQRIKAGELCNYFKAYVTLFNSDKIEIKNYFQATVDAGLLSAANEARELYEKEMDAECGPTKPGVTHGDVQHLHRKYLDASREVFNNKITMASPVEVVKHLDKLTKDLENQLPQFEQSNLSKLQATIKQANDLYEEMINNIKHKHQPLCLHPLDLETSNKEAVQAALKLYDAQVKAISDKPDHKRAELTQNLENRYLNLMLKNENNNKAVVQELFLEYLKLMSSKCEYMNTKSARPPLTVAEFKSEHDAGLSEALNKFQTNRNRSSSYPKDIYREELEKLITDIFRELQAINQTNIEQERRREEEERKIQEAEKVRLDYEQKIIAQEAAIRNQEMEKLETEIQRLKQEKHRIEIETQEKEKRREEDERKTQQVQQVKLALEKKIREQETAISNLRLEKLEAEIKIQQQDKQRLELENQMLANSRKNPVCEFISGMISTVANATIFKII